MDYQDLERLLEEYLPSDRVDEALDYVKDIQNEKTTAVQAKLGEILVLKEILVKGEKLIKEMEAAKYIREAEIAKEKMELMQDLVKTVFRGPLPATPPTYHVSQWGSIPVWVPSGDNGQGHFSSQPFNVSGDSIPFPSNPQN